MLTTIASSTSFDVDIDWTAIALGVIAAAGSITAAWVSHRTNKRVKTSNGTTIGQRVESMEDSVASTAAAIAKTLEEARLVREHEVTEAILLDGSRKIEQQDLEHARQRVSDEIERLTKIAELFSAQKAADEEGKTDG